MKKTKNPNVDLRLQYWKVLEIALILSLVIHISFFLGRPDIIVTRRDLPQKNFEIEVQDIPPTEQVKLPPAPVRPSVPIPTESESVPEDLTIESTELDLSDLPTPPPPPEQEDLEAGYVFVPFDEPPYPIGGMMAIQKNLRYPEIAKKTGIEATIVIGVLIDEKGNPIKTEVLKGSGTAFGFEQAASEAVMAVQWQPAKQRDRPVKVWASIPIRFRISGEVPVTPAS